MDDFILLYRHLHLLPLHAGDLQEDHPYASSTQIGAFTFIASTHINPVSLAIYYLHIDTTNTHASH